MVAVRFAVASHILVLLALGSRSDRVGRPAAATSNRLAGVVNTNPVVVRRITGQLARAGLLRVHRGRGGAELARPAAAITLNDVWTAVNAGADRPLVPLQASSTERGDRTVVDPIAPVLQAAFADAERAFRGALGQTTLASLARRAGQSA